MGVERARAFRTPICDALSTMHARRFIHRDIKPGNILLSPSGEPLLVDFSLAYHPNLDGFEKRGVVCGTLRFMSPECIREGTLTPASDVYALGITLYQMLTGAIPFNSGNIPDPRDSVPKIPSWAVSVVRRATDRDPRWRYQSADELKHALMNETQERLPTHSKKNGRVVFFFSWLFGHRERKST